MTFMFSKKWPVFIGIFMGKNAIRGNRIDIRRYSQKQKSPVKVRAEMAKVGV